MVKAVEEFGAAMLIDTPVWRDDRGFFTENWNNNWQKQLGIRFDVKQTNSCWTEKANTLRGMHAQYGMASMAKLVRCIRGEIVDVVIDARQSSPTFGQWKAFRLNGPEHSVFVPDGFYHGYVTLTDDVIVLYNQDNTHNPGLECGTNFMDGHDFWVNQGFDPRTFKVSEKDLAQPNWATARKFV